MVGVHNQESSIHICAMCRFLRHSHLDRRYRNAGHRSLVVGGEVDAASAKSAADIEDSRSRLDLRCRGQVGRQRYLSFLFRLSPGRPIAVVLAPERATVRAYRVVLLSDLLLVVMTRHGPVLPGDTGSSFPLT